MSGGIDSSYAALLFTESGAEAVGVTGLMTKDDVTLDVVKTAKA